MAGINEVRTDLERYYPEPTALQRGQDSQREGGFPGSALSSRYNNSFNRTPPAPSLLIPDNLTTGPGTEFLQWFVCLQEALSSASKPALHQSNKSAGSEWP